ncbi:MAG TPA: hypothetical protein VJK03_02625 [Candidatus Nanoarchaeia archaeon]|nr:hypothetical protein [Candidatus Nanoarchaeia archaeon]
MKRSVIIILLCIGIAIAIALAGASLYLQWDKKVEMKVGNEPAVRINYSNFEQQVVQQPFIKDLPAEGVILLQFYNFAEGNRVLENSYVLKKNSVTKNTVDAPDATIMLHAKYLDSLTNKNFCSVIADARNNGDFAIENRLSASAFAWKYRSMLKYKSCLGM